MLIKTAAALSVFCFTTLAQAVELRVATFNIGAHLVVPPGGGAAYFDYGLGPSGTPDHDTVRDILDRIDADVVALQEIHGADVSAGDIAALAVSLGYPHSFISPSTNTFDPSLRVGFLSRYPFLTSTSVASPPNSKELTRLFPAVKVDVPGTDRDPLLISAHLKSGEANADLFRRSVEMRRLTGHLNAQGFSGEENYVVLGDFNLSASDRLFTAIPSGMPGGFLLAPDISGSVPPINYHTNPRRYFTGAPVVLLDPRQLDNSPSTFRSGSVIDLVLVSPILAARPIRMEIYNSALDSSNSAGIPKSGSPPAPGTSVAASDHYPLIVDLELDPAVPYAFTAAGETVTESFTGFPGTYNPAPWERTGGKWKGAEGGSRAVSGFRAYGPATDPSLGFLPGATPGTATATFTNQSNVPLTALQISFTAEQWRSYFGGTADSLGVELIVGGTPVPLPQLAFSASNNLATGAIPGGTTALRNTTLSGLSVAPGASFQLRFTFTPGAGGGAAPGDVFVNEFHYDNTGADVGEFVEIVVGPDFQDQLSEIDVLFYNGSNGAIYKTLNLAGLEFSRTTTSNFFDILVADLGATIQNGPDGIALANRTTNQVLHFLSYEGAFTATEGSALGIASTSIGVTQTGSEGIGVSALGLTGSGGVRTDYTWSKIAGPYSKGQPNAGQNLVVPALPSQGIAIDNLTVTFLTDTDVDGLPDIIDADDDNDGLSDADELVFGTNPLDATSRFAMSFAYPSPAPGAVRITFPTAIGRTYVVESSPDLSIWSGVGTYAGTGSPRVADIPVDPEENAKFYRIRAVLP